jgi:hypothetical protein
MADQEQAGNQLRISSSQFMAKTSIEQQPQEKNRPLRLMGETRPRTVTAAAAAAAAAAEGSDRVDGCGGPWLRALVQGGKWSRWSLNYSIT